MLDKIKNGAYIINLDEYSDIGTHWITLYVNNKTATYIDSFGIEHIPQVIRVSIANKDIMASIYKIQSYDLIICGYYCIGFTDYIFKDKSLTDFTNLFSLKNFKKNDDII